MDFAKLRPYAPIATAILKAAWLALPQGERDAIVAALLRELRAQSGWILDQCLAYVRHRIAEGAPLDVFGDLTRFPDWSIANDAPNQGSPSEEP